MSGEFKFISRNGETVCANCGLPIEIGAPNHGLGWALNGRPLQGHERSRLGFDKFDLCICENNSDYENEIEPKSDSLAESTNLNTETRQFKRLMLIVLILSLIIGIFTI